MRIEAIEYILEVVQCGSISAASRKVYTQQTTLSAAIKSVEKELGITIFNRQFDGVILTEEGMAFLDLARPMVETYHLMKHLNHSNDQVITLHINPILYSIFCSEVITELYKRFPVLSTNIKEIAADKLFETMKSDFNMQIGIGYCSLKQLEAHRKQAGDCGFSFIPLLRTEMLVYVHQNNILSVKQGIKPEELRNQTMILNAYCTELFLELGLDTIVKNYNILEFSTPAPLFTSLRNSNMIIIAADKRVLSKILLSANDCIPLHIESEDSLRYFYQHYVVYRKRRNLSENETAMIEFICETFKE